jgi:predicted adenine nucleotide alpha hydrolase (AANH) superfamily ATPase
MNILLHQCCGPCSIYPIEQLLDEGHDIRGFFYNPNIHPVQEFYKRLESTVDLNDSYNIKTIINEEYGLQEFTRNVVYRENNRCTYCYAMRIEKTAQIAKSGKFDAFTSSLLYSKFQNHEQIKDLCKSVATKYDVGFYYYDYREGWKEGIIKSKEKGLYRQQYCGCIYSEEDRYLKQLSNKFKKEMELKSAV